MSGTGTGSKASGARFRRLNNSAGPQSVRQRIAISIPYPGEPAGPAIRGSGRLFSKLSERVPEEKLSAYFSPVQVKINLLQKPF
jgi:hypothetical protein